MPSTHLNLREDDVVRLALEFLHHRDLHITQLSLERETGVINGNYADDVLFLRQLILDGQWDDVLEFIQPLSALKSFEADKFNYAILRHKYIELLCIRSEIKAYNNVENIVDEVVKVLSDLEKLAPSKEEYSNLCLLLTLPSITDHAQFKKWNPSNARVQCFREVYPLVEQFLPCDKKSSNTISKCAKNDRLMQLLIKGILYESCVNYCQAKATGSKEAQSNEVNFSRLLDGSGFDESDLSLLSWLQSIPSETFSVPFEQRMLNVDVEKLERPSLHTSWTEHMLVTPIKPRTFPHLAMPFRRPRSAADAMTRSLRPLPDGAPRHPALMALSAIDYGPSSSCFAGFHLTGIKGSKLMNTSVDRLFDNKNGESIFNGLNESLKPIDEQSKTDSKNNSQTPSSIGASAATTPEHRAQDYSACTSISTAPCSGAERAPRPPEPAAALVHAAGDFRRDLLKEYQIQKQRECDDYLRNLCSSDLRQQKTMEMSDISPAFASNENHPPHIPNSEKPREGQETQQFLRKNEISDAPETDDLNSSRLSADRERHASASETFPETQSRLTADLVLTWKMTAVKKTLALRQLDSMFGNISLDGEGRRSPLVSCTIEHDPRCDVHGRCSTPYRSSLYLHSRESTPAFGRDSSSPTNGLIIRRRDSNRLSSSPGRELEHPSSFPSLLRRDRLSPSVTPPRRDTPSPTHKYTSNKRHSMGSFPNLSRANIVNYRRDSTASNGVREMKRDYVGSTNSLSRKSSKDTFGSSTTLSRKSSKDYTYSTNSLSRKSSIDTKKSSTDSLDFWHTSWETEKNNSISSLANDERLSLGYHKTQNRNGGHQVLPSAVSGIGAGPEMNGSRPTFKPVTVLEDLQAVRCAEFHPNGKLYAVGSNTKTLRICSYPKIEDVKDNSAPTAPTVLLKRTKHHKGSIYCLAWSPAGDLLATGSNDKTVKMMRFDSHSCNLEGQEVELGMHDGTVRDVCFIEDTSNKTSLLVSGGAGDCKIYVTDCATGKTFQALSGHSGHVLSLYNWGGAMFVSGSQDKTVRFWDLRTGGCVNVISPPTGLPSKGAAVTSLAVDPSGRLLVCGHDDGSSALHDVRGSRALQRFTPHSGDVRSVRFSPGAYYLLTAGYDGRVVLTDLQGDLTCPLPSVPVARHPDKVISARWHPDDFSFLSTSADKTAVLWTIPPV